ncbi:TPA: 3'-5' exonuclease [Escherichia coli]|uniref:3'-5' exonuclease n=1 Tax=Escherichia coli TaxID=562 RepID=UPI000BE34D45|nr:3'-5' exonuclease [Escherichia coli]EFC1957336.1 3'-5' exoribonuclease [Escherichia coli]EFH8176494.1 3'-5' exoribonuclease [Escherichia coli]EFJ3221087.1 3'-5' exoribonuclease [Escherichia coli]EGK3902303.1 3'-5' exoribonuclease [Escherichia coli]EIP9254051.1 3'-5' exoribonuclease [Escherichia coli]
MNHLMLDMETLGVSVSAPIISIAAVFFDPKTSSIGDSFYKVITLESSLKNALIEPETLAWWMLQSDEARRVFNDVSAVKLHDALHQLSDFVKENGKPDQLQVWGNGASFDNAIIAHAFRASGLELPWHFRNDRDVRTIVSLCKELKKVNVLKSIMREGVHHNALDDAIYQARYVSLAYALLSNV